VDRNVLQGGMTYIDTTQIDINLTTQKLSDIGQAITDRIKESFDIDLSFDYMNMYGYLFISGIMPDANTSLIFYFTNEWTCNYFSLPDDDNIDINHDTVKLFGFNNDTNNWYQPLSDFDLSHVYLNWDLVSTGYVCEIVGEVKNRTYAKEYGIADIKVSGIVDMSSKTDFNIRLTNDGRSSGVYIWLTRLMLE
jgi:hypothetical protein